MCQNYGKLVLLTSLPDPSSCHVTGKIAEVAIAGDMVAAVVQAINFDGKPCEEAIKSFECELVSEITGTSRASCRLMRKGQSQYEISYQPIPSRGDTSYTSKPRDSTSEGVLFSKVTSREPWHSSPSYNRCG